MAKKKVAKKNASSGTVATVPDPRKREAFRKWLEKQPRQWSLTVATRAALRAFPLVQGSGDFQALILLLYRAAAIARFSARYPNREVSAAASNAFSALVFIANSKDFAAFASVMAAQAASTADIASVAESASNAVANAIDWGKRDDEVAAAIKDDADRLHSGAVTPEALARDRLWPFSVPSEFAEASHKLLQQLRAMGDHWSVWIDWDDTAANSTLLSEAEDAAFTDIPGKLPWDGGAEVVNTEIARRLAEIRNKNSTEIPDQVSAPVRVEERDGRVSKASDRDSALNASERDFRAWRDSVVDHIGELTTSDFAPGTNHGRLRDRLTSLGRLLPGEIDGVKERQFRIGYEIERFEGLMAAYRSAGEDMPILNAAQLEDLDRLRVALRMGIDKLERWTEFRRQANESTAGEAGADRAAVSDALDEMASAMEQHPRYFDPEVPASFRFLAESVRDPSGATKTIVYGAVKSAENLVGFLGQRALGIGKKGLEAVETHISKAVATLLVAGLSSAALGLSFALPQGWVWLKPLLTALGIGG